MHRIISDEQYEWLLRNLPKRIMYKRILLDGVYIWIPKWGWTKKQISDAENKTIETLKKIKFD